MKDLTQSTAVNAMVFMTGSADHITGATGKTLSIEASKNGAAFAGIVPTVTERGYGWYSIALTTGHTDTLGDLALHITAAGCDPADMVFNVVAAAGGGSGDWSAGEKEQIRQALGITGTKSATSGGNLDAVKAKTDNLPATPAAVGSQMNLADGAITAAKYAAGAIDANAIAADAITAAKIAAGAITSSEAPALANLDAAVSTRLASAGYTAPNNADIANIKAKTDNLPADPASNTQVNTRLAAASYTAPNNADIANIKAKTDNLPSDPADESLLEAAIATRMAAASYTAPDNAGIAAIKAKTDNLPSGIKRNTVLNNFTLLMVDGANHWQPKAGLSVSAQYSIDGGAFASCANSVSEVSNGTYKLNLLAAELNGAVITLRFTAAGADDRIVTIFTEA